jgi:hypothetical protein
MFENRLSGHWQVPVAKLGHDATILFENRLSRQVPVANDATTIFENRLSGHWQVAKLGHDSTIMFENRLSRQVPVPVAKLRYDSTMFENRLSRSYWYRYRYCTVQVHFFESHNESSAYRNYRDCVTRFFTSIFFIKQLHMGPWYTVIAFLQVDSISPRNSILKSLILWSAVSMTPMIKFAVWVNPYRYFFLANVVDIVWYKLPTGTVCMILGLIFPLKKTAAWNM